MRLLVLLTASIDPMGRANVKRADPQARLGDYAASLRNWLAVVRDLPADILFCENSGWPLGELERVVSRSGMAARVTFSQFRGNDYPTELGKGFGEARIIDHAIASVVASDGRHDAVVKCTGRLFVRNARSLLPRRAVDADIMCLLDGALTQADSRFFIARAEVLATSFAGMGPEVDEAAGIYLEHVLCRRVLRAIGEGRTWKPLPARPLYSGWSATHDRRYDSIPMLGRWLLHRPLRRLRYRPRSPL